VISPIHESLPGLGRRDFLRAGALFGGALVVAFTIPGSRARAAGSSTGSNSGSSPDASTGATPFAPNAWLRIGADDSVTIIVDRSEMGQGIYTSLPMLIAEELEAEWSKVKIEPAPADPVYTNPLLGAQGTGGSTSTRAAWLPLRQAGAAAREMLIDAAAKTWGVDRSECKAENGAIVHAKSGKSARFGALAEAASALPVPKDPPLKDPKDFKLLGIPGRRLDTPSKTDGSAQFSLDVRLPGMKYAVVARCPVMGGKLATFDDTHAKTVPGVRAVIPIESGVAVVADSTWQALKGRDALVVTWSEGKNADLSSDSIHKSLVDRAEKPGALVRNDGDAEKALETAVKRVEAQYEVPFMAHATMEPMNCTADVRADGCDLYAPTQFQGWAQATAAAISGHPLEKVKVHTTLLGGGFGRRGEMDFIAESVQISKAIGAPAKVVWTRADDMQHDVYRPSTYTKLAAALDRNGKPLALWSRIVGPSIMTRVLPQLVQGGIDKTSTEGLADHPYAIPNVHVEYALHDLGVPVGFWRSVGNSQNGFILESFIDELADASGDDPLEFRRALLRDKPRHKAVLEAAAKVAGWGRKMPEGSGLGIAVLESFGTFVAHVAEVSVVRDGRFKVQHVWCAIDCGMTVNPDTIEAQMQGCIIWGLSMLKGRITLDKGRVQQSNFHDFPIARIEETPKIDVMILKSAEAPGGCGEPGVPPLAPAVANAIFAACGKRVRRLPIVREDLARS
jgi:isoquinoline 1-oxidoreductase beta subunit